MKEQRGFTLAEALVAVAILAIVLATTLFAVTQGMRGLRENGNMVVARAAASRQMELLRNKPFADLLPLNGQDFTNDLPESLPDPKEGKIYVDVEPNTVNQDLLRVTVTVSVSGRSWQLVSLLSQ